jgi:hypothetical protein
MVTREKLQELHPDEDLLFADGFDAAILGVVRRFSEGGHVCVVLYDRAKAIKRLQRRRRLHGPGDSGLGGTRDCG